MVKARRKIVIDNLAKTQLKEAYSYIKLDSPKSAEKVKVSPEQITVITIRHTKMKPRLH